MEVETAVIWTPFPCWMCGGTTVKLYGTYTRYCGRCQVAELRLAEPYVPRTLTQLVSDDGIPYVDHSAVHLPSPG